MQQSNLCFAFVALRSNLDEPRKQVLQAMDEIHAIHGRIRTIKNGPRTLDCDLILYSDVHLSTEALTLPHPRMHERDFVLQPLAEIEPTWSEYV